MHMNKNSHSVFLQLAFFLAYLMMSAVAVGEPDKVIMASVPKLGGGSLEFAIPAAFRPKVSENFFTLTADLPGFPDADYSGTRARSLFLIVRTRPKFGTLAFDILNGLKANLKEMPEQNGCRVFIETVPGKNTSIIYFLFNDERGNPVVVTDPGEWSGSYHWEHAYTEGYEIKAEVNKKYGTEFQKVDKKIVNFVNSIMRR
ncbi:hypothetical protein D9O50_09615 [Oxalobacteraceae bacterium CAVE-383]|nr:hypothetical protein D9O50_09615 [Oxalobacteraceae bacterium CAVE-383]